MTPPPLTRSAETASWKRRANNRNLKCCRVFRGPFIRPEDLFVRRRWRIRHEMRQGYCSRGQRQSFLSLELFIINEDGSRGNSTGLLRIKSLGGVRANGL